jgi:lipocalin
MVPMEATQYQNYGGSWYKVGDRIAVASETDASDMEALYLAKRVRSVPFQPTTREMIPGDAGKTTTQPAQDDKKNKKDKRYKHREMRVEPH